MKGTDKEKKLASQFIAKFTKSFPELENEAIDAMFDLCEDDDVAVSLFEHPVLEHYLNLLILQTRKQAVKDLVMICKENKGAVRKISYALAQILQSEDASEVQHVQNSITQLYQIDSMGNFINLHVTSHVTCLILTQPPLKHYFRN